MEWGKKGLIKLYFKERYVDSEGKLQEQGKREGGLSTNFECNFYKNLAYILIHLYTKYSRQETYRSSIIHFYTTSNELPHIIQVLSLLET